MRPALTGVPQAPLHVLEVVGNAIVGGMESWVERFIARMPPERMRFTVLCPAEGPFADRLRRHGAVVHALPMDDDPSWMAIQTTLALVKAEGVDLLHAHLPRAHVLAGLVGRLAQRPVIATLHGREVGVQDLEIQRATGSHLSLVCRQSYHHALALGVSPEQLSCIPNGVDTQAFRPRLRRAGGLRDALQLAPEAPLVGFVGRLSPEKGPELFVHAVQAFAAGCPAAQAVVVGDGPLRPAVAALVDELGLRGRLHLAGVREDMPEVYAELDLLVSTSYSEAMPLALMEGMACGLPVVATRVGGVPDLVEHGQTGWLAAPGDAQAIAVHCTKLLQDVELRRRQGERGRERVVQRFDLAEGVARIGELIERLAARPAAAAEARPRQLLRQS